MLWSHRGYAGDLSVEQIEEEHNFKFTDEEKEYLKNTHCTENDFKNGKSGWHMFDNPKFVIFTDDKIGHISSNIFTSHNDEFDYYFPKSYIERIEND